MKKILSITLISILLIYFCPLLINQAKAWTSAECTEYCKHIIDFDQNAICQAECLEGSIVNKQQIIDLIIKITNWFAGIVFAIAVIMILYGGALYMTAGGEEEKAGKAKKLLTYALVGIAVAILAFGAKALITSFLEMAFIPTAFAQYAYDSPIIHYSDIGNLISSITTWFAGIVSAVAVIMILYGGVLYMTARGDEEKAGKAKKLITYALIGIAVAILAFGAQFLVRSFLTAGSASGSLCNTKWKECTGIDDTTSCNTGYVCTVNCRCKKFQELEEIE